jgi:hypothetical protein
MRDNDTDQVIADDDNEGQTKDPRESNISSDIEERDFHYQQEVLLSGQAAHKKSLRTTRIPPPKNAAMLIQLFYALFFQIPKNHLGQ